LIAKKNLTTKVVYDPLSNGKYIVVLLRTLLSRNEEVDMSKGRIIDLSSPIQQTPPDSVLKVEVQYINHQEGRKIFGPLFGLEDGDFPEGNFSAVEKLTLTTHSGTHLDAPWHYWPTSEGKPSKTIDQIPRPFGFKVAVFPVKIERASAGWVRAVAILEE